MSKPHHVLHVALWAVVLSVAGCGRLPEPPTSQQGLAFRSISQAGACDLDNTVIKVYPGGYYNPDAEPPAPVYDPAYSTPLNSPDGGLTQGSGPIEPSQVGEVDDLDLGGLDTDLQGVYWISDYFLTLAIGFYDVEVTVYDTQGGIIGTELRNDLQVFSGQTTETSFVFYCDGNTVSGLDVAILVNEGPSVTGFEYQDGKFQKVCGANCMTATLQAGTDGEQLDVIWEAFPHDTGGGPLTYPGDTSDFDPATNPAPYYSTDLLITGGDTEWCFVCEAPGTYDIWMTTRNEAGLLTRVQTLAHCDDPVVGYCDYDTEPSGLGELYQTAPGTFAAPLRTDEGSLLSAQIRFLEANFAGIRPGAADATVGLRSDGRVKMLTLDGAALVDADIVGSIDVEFTDRVERSYALLAPSPDLGTFSDAGRGTLFQQAQGATLYMVRPYGLDFEAQLEIQLANGTIEAWHSGHYTARWVGTEGTFTFVPKPALGLPTSFLGDDRFAFVESDQSGFFALPTCRLSDAEPLDATCVQSVPYFNEGEPPEAEMVPCTELTDAVCPY